MYDSDWNENALYQHDILKRHKKLITEMAKDRVFSVGFNENKFFVAEECDEYFSHIITKEEAYELSEMFREIAEYMERN